MHEPIRAYALDDGFYRLSGSTYGLREQIKAEGGMWDGTRWTVSDEARRALGIERMVEAIVGHRRLNKPDEHKQRKLIMEREAVAGSFYGFCDYCDGRCRMDVLDYLDIEKKTVGEQ